MSIAAEHQYSLPFSLAFRRVTNVAFQIVNYFSFSFRSFSSTSNFDVINLTDSARSTSCFSPLICVFLFSFRCSYISITFASSFSKQLNEISLQPDESISSLKISPSSAKLAELASRIFLGSSSVYEVSLRSLFFEELLKNLIICFMITNKFNNTSKICS